MILMRELIKDEDFESLSPEIQKNLENLLIIINNIRTLYDTPMIVTSGLRTMEEHLAIYAKKGITDKTKIPMKSKHLFGLAVDISDPNGELKTWCKNNEKTLKEIGVWMEDFSSTPNWVHFQIVPYGSYKEGKSLWFNP
jgi:uncharacterized protein YcbK (DUF882 family)